MKFINTRKISFGSLSLVVSLFGVNVEGAIAQNTQKSGRYLSNQEIQSFEVEIQAELRSGSRFYLDRRTSLEINQINDFVRAWQKVDPSIAPYLGSWTGFESGVDIYPSSTKGQVCIVSTGIGINQYTFGVGRVSSNKLLLEGEDGKTVIVTKRGILQSGNTINFIVEFGSYNGRNGRSSYIYPRIPRKISANKLARLGCTTSFPSISTTILSVPTSSKPVKPTNSGDGYPTDAEIQRLESEFQRASRGVTGRGYTDRRQSSMVIQINNFVNDWRKVDPSISPFLGNWGGLEEGLRIYPSTSKGKVCVIYSSYGPNGTQSSFNSGTVSENKLTSDGEAGKTLILKKTAPDREGNTVDFLGSFRSDRNSGVVTAYVFPITLAPTNDARFARLGCTDSLPSSSNTASLPSVNNAIPLISGSSTPVKQANTIARYPTNDDFKKVDRILQASRNPESLVNLKGNQQDQRLKFQKEWESRNPAAAKFLGSWYTGDKSFYVYPSTSKGGTCVITKDNQGNLDLQIGAVLNKELRYGGGKGFFWIDRTNIIASRDSNSGDLYPIYATSEVPELSESTISDMQSQKCITTLPTTPVATKQLPQKTSGQLLSNENVACTTEFKTLLGQTASAYCKSSQVDSGIIFDDIKVTKNADRSVKLELRMFNRGSAEGFVEVYDSNKKLQDIKIIDGNKPPTGLLQSSYGLFVEVPASVFSRYPLGDDRRSLKEQILDVTIPAGGYVQITKSSNFAVNYNTAMLLLEISQLTGGDPGFIQEASTKKFLVGFAKEVSSEARINIFKGEVNIQSIASMEFVDKKKLAEVFQKLVKYSASIEKEPSKNPIFSSFSDVILTTGNIGLEQALDVVVPGLGSLSRNVRNGGDSLNVAARAIDIKNSIAADRKATIIFRNTL